ncbi:MAG: DMT family transporter [Candidatus Latescibacteria bacterium]|nr:DMT family transporter [Candidatus Latescibacterota bacterium]MEE3041504.1 DMT family transporter [Candidatus Latescibacterota bacterium]MEE3338222.1 DMT family transporter [Candidatus Latescibacterota bacterium]
MGPGAAGLAVLTSALWGGNQVAIKAGLEGMPPVAMAVARFALGLGIVFIAAAIARISVLRVGGQWRGLVELSLLFTAQIVLLNIGSHHTTSSRAIVLISAYPFFTALFAHLLIPGDRLSFRQVMGMVLAFAGIVTLFAGSLSLTETAWLLGDALVLGSGVLLGLRQVVIKRLVHDLHPYQVLFWQAAFGLPLFIIGSAIFESTVDIEWTRRAVLGVLYQGLIVAGACFIILVTLLSRHPASRLGVFGFITPVVGVVLSMWVMDEALSMVVVASMAMVASGTTLGAIGAPEPNTPTQGSA